MNRGKLAAVFSLILALIFAFGVSRKMHAQDSKIPYPSMAPLDQYLMPDREAEIALARSAAPDSISGEAEVLVLGKAGYETAVQGKNGFVCLVERSWTAGINAPEFWNPKLRGPLCLESAGGAVLPSAHDQKDRVGHRRADESADVRAVTCGHR